MIVVYASIAIKWLNQQEADREAALFLYERHLREEERISVPHFLFVEVANVLATKPYYSAQDVTDGLQLLFTSHLIVHEPANEDIAEAAALAKHYTTSVYDMLYAVLAKRHNCPLITADE